MTALDPRMRPSDIAWHFLGVLAGAVLLAGAVAYLSLRRSK